MSFITCSRRDLDYKEMGHLCFYFLTFNNWSEHVPCDEIFVWTKDKVKNQTYLDFCCKLAWELIDNAILKQQEAAVEERRMMLYNNHKHLNAPTHARCFKDGKWNCTNKQPYQQLKCRTVSFHKKFEHIAAVALESGCAKTVMVSTWWMWQNNLQKTMINSLL